MRATIVLVLVTVFRDATLFRETVEYMWDHHRLDYKHSTFDPELRIHAIVTLWMVNGVWLIAPLLSSMWGFQKINQAVLAWKSKIE